MGMLPRRAGTHSLEHAHAASCPGRKRAFSAACCLRYAAGWAMKWREEGRGTRERRRKAHLAWTGKGKEGKNESAFWMMDASGGPEENLDESEGVVGIYIRTVFDSPCS